MNYTYILNSKENNQFYTSCANNLAVRLKRICLKKKLSQVDLATALSVGDKETFEMKDDLLESEWEKFMEVNPVDQAHYAPVKNLFKAYTTDKEIREIIDAPNGELWGKLYTTPSLSFEEFNACNGFRQTVPQHVRDYAYHLTNL